MCRIRIDKLSLMITSSIGILFLLVSLPLAEVKQLGKTQVFKIEQITKEQFKTLPDNAMVEFKGRQMTKRQFIAESEQKAKEIAQGHKAQAEAKGKAEFEARRAKFLQEEKQRIAANNAKARAEFLRLKQHASSAQAQRVSAIRQEAIQLNIRAKNASPAELEQIDKRAGQLIHELNQLGYRGGVR